MIKKLGEDIGNSPILFVVLLEIYNYFKILKGFSIILNTKNTSQHALV